MNYDTIRTSVRTLFDEMGELAVDAVLRQKTNDGYVPGSAATATVTETAVRFFPMDEALSAARNEADSVIGPVRRHGLIECETAVPGVDDDLVFADTVASLLQVVPVDAGAGILYEVTYQ